MIRELKTFLVTCDICGAEGRAHAVSNEAEAMILMEDVGWSSRAEVRCCAACGPELIHVCPKCKEKK